MVDNDIPLQRTYEDVTGAARPQTHTLGTVRTNKEGTGERILVPQPSDDPNDPLTWTLRYKLYLSLLVSFSLFMSNAFLAGPSVTMVETAVDIFDVIPPTPLVPASLAPASIAAFNKAIEDCSYLFTVPSLLQGMSNLVYIPLAVKYGRRPVYVLSFTLLAACCLWCALARSYPPLLAGRIIGSWFAGMAECIVPLTIADIFFLHERASYMAMYSVALSAGGAIGSVLAGAMSVSLPWWDIYYLFFAITVLVTVLIYFTMPETYFVRTFREEPVPAAHNSTEKADGQRLEAYSSISDVIPPKKTFRQRIALFDGAKTDESLLKIFIRPILILGLPHVLWATVCLGLAVGIYVIISTILANDFTRVYHFTTWQVGMVWWAVVIGALIGLPMGGIFSDWCADYLSKRNNGIREPEFRLPALVPPWITLTSSVLLYGLGLNYQTHWIVPVVGIAFFSFGLSASGSITMVYTIDSYRPIAGEVVVTQMGFKGLVAFLMAFYCNPWIAHNGHDGVFGALAGIIAFVFALWIPLYIWGKKLRYATLQWRLMKVLEWDVDRETGE